jgi:hypothetical protein
MAAIAALQPANAEQSACYSPPIPSWPNSFSLPCARLGRAARFSTPPPNGSLLLGVWGHTGRAGPDIVPAPDLFVTFRFVLDAHD